MNTNIGKANRSGDGSPVSASTALRQQAQLRCGDSLPDNITPLSLEETRHTLHELRVHQIELEMQNEELRRTQLELEAARANYFDLYDLAPCGYCTVNEKGIIQQSNLTAALLLGMPRGALVKQAFSRFIFHLDQDIYYLCRQRLLDTEQVQSCELRMIIGDALIWVRLTITAAQNQQDETELRIALTDITESKQAALAVQESEARYQAISEMLKSKNVELEAALAMADKANHAKSDFLAHMSHELRTPLSAILGFAQLIDSDTPPPSPSQKQRVEHILKAGWYLLKLIDEILDLVQVESGKLTVNMETVSLTKIVNECQIMVGPLAQNHGINVTVYPLKTPYYVQADPIRLKQTLINLLSNAVKYNRPGGTVVVDCTKHPVGQRVRIRVQDTGMGLSHEKLGRLFQPFNRLGQESSAVQGTGIGLVMCKRLIELMGGNIGVTSTVGKGSVFWIDLKLAEPSSQAATQIKAPPPPATQVQSNTNAVRNILYIEDNAANMMLVEHIIARRLDLRLLQAQDGARGIELARIYRPDVILMDINLPDISGIEAFNILRKDPLTAHIPVIVLSANAMPDDIEHALKAGFFNYLAKPVVITQLLDALDSALERTASSAVKPS